MVFGMTALTLGFLLAIMFIFLIIIIFSLIHMAIRRKWGWFWSTLILTLLSATFIAIIVIIVYWSIRLAKGDVNKK